MKKDMKKRVFTLVELMLAMSIFAVLMLILMQIFGSTQDVWRRTGAKAESSESARIALNIIAEDLANAVYVEDVRGKSFEHSGSDLWFVTKKPYAIDPGQRSMEVEVKYHLRANTSAENTEENVPSGLTLNKLEYCITTDSVVTLGASITPNGYDFRSNTNAHNTPASPTPRGILLDNVLSFSITPLYVTVSGSTVSTANCSNRLPNLVLISLTVLDNDNAVRNRYIGASAADKAQISRTYSKVVPIQRGQVY